MSARGAGVYQGLALLAMLAHVVVVGLFALLLLYTTSYPIHVVATILLKTLIVLVWFGALVLGVTAWRERRWRVILVPMVTFGVVWLAGQIGTTQLGWSLGFFT